ncbi:MAG: flagellar hook capping protein [Clostridium sp.]|nr:flagellar hook capping protein [Clostridium sp.]MCM1547568.1 flagellar hook capping protein [Ruminococcus sp.]
MAVNGVNTDRNYTETLNGGKTTGKVYNAVFSNDEDDNLSINEFFDMMILQLTNQDFMNPVDDTQYLSQMAQFATMQEMMDLCQYSKQNYVMSMLGKTVTVSKNEIGGKVTSTTGVVEKIGIEDDEFKVYVDGKAYDLNKVTQVAGETAAAGTVKPDESDADEIGNTDDTTISDKLDIADEKAQQADG